MSGQGRLRAGEGRRAQARAVGAAAPNSCPRDATAGGSRPWTEGRGTQGRSSVSSAGAGPAPEASLGARGWVAEGLVRAPASVLAGALWGPRSGCLARERGSVDSGRGQFRKDSGPPKAPPRRGGQRGPLPGGRSSENSCDRVTRPERRTPSRPAGRARARGGRAARRTPGSRQQGLLFRPTLCTLVFACTCVIGIISAAGSLGAFIRTALGVHPPSPPTPSPLLAFSAPWNPAYGHVT